MAEVGYLIGAGASAQCVPVVNGMAHDALDTNTKLKEIFNSPKGEIISRMSNLDHLAITKESERLLGEISQICKNQASIDTYAKKLYLGRKIRESKKLKNELSFYFTLVQILNPPDKRYDNFWASILNNNTHLPNKVSVLSWNYDFQFEKTYMEFAGIQSMNSVWSNLNICSPSTPMERFGEQNFNFTKLNGSARFKNSEFREGCYYCDFKKNNIIASLADLFRVYYAALRDESDNTFFELNFAWEEFNRHRLIESIKPVLNKIEILVIIGYSFPFFNRKVDQVLFDQMTSLKKIIIQDVNPHSIHERLIEIIPQNEYAIELRSDLEQFVFPKELDV